MRPSLLRTSLSLGLAVTTAACSSGDETTSSESTDGEGSNRGSDTSSGSDAATGEPDSGTTTHWATDSFDSVDSTGNEASDGEADSSGTGRTADCDAIDFLGSELGTSVGTSSITWLATGDVDGDGYDDAVVGGIDDYLAVYFGGPNGVQSAEAFEVGGFAFHVGVGDVDGDGDGDVIVNDANSAIEIRPWIGDGFGQDIYLTNVTGAVTVADLDANGDPDVVVATDDDTGGGLQVHFGAPGTEFVTEVLFEGGSIVDVDVVDVDGDDELDIVALQHEPGADDATVRVFLGDGGQLSAQSPLSISGSYGLTITSGDLDANGYTDFVYGNPGSIGAFWWVKANEAGYGDPEFVDAYPVSIARAADFDRDGRDDFALMGPSGLAVFSEPVGFVANSVGDGGSSLALADFNADGWTDIVVPTTTGGIIAWHNSCGPNV